MIAKMKCSNCGAEMSNLNMSWGRKQMWFVIPIMLVGFLPLIKMTFFKGDPVKDLSISDVQKKNVGKSMEITGLITNSTSRSWSSVSVEVEFFDSAGKFIDEANQRINSDVGSHAKEHFKVEISSPSEQILADGVKHVVKIAGGYTSPF